MCGFFISELEVILLKILLRMRAIYVILAWPGECSYKAKPNTTCTGSELRLELDIYLTSPLLTEELSSRESGVQL